MRTRFSELLIEYAKADPKFIVICADHGYELFNAIRKECPKQFLNVGICEQAMIGIAAGLAREGLKPVVYGLACFLLRAYEQIKLDICLPALNVVIIGDGAGQSYKTLGPTHQSTEDLACMNALTHLAVLESFTSRDFEDHFNQAMQGSGSWYLRFVPNV